MGMFKDMKDMKKMANDLQKDNPRPSLREGLSQAKDAMAGAQGQMAAAQLAADPNARDGSAVINAVRDTGMTVNENPSVEFDLSVTAGGFTYETTHTQIVSRLQVGQLQPGAQVNVKIDASGPEHAADRLTAGAGVVVGVVGGRWGERPGDVRRRTPEN